MLMCVRVLTRRRSFVGVCSHLLTIHTFRVLKVLTSQMDISAFSLPLCFFFSIYLSKQFLAAKKIIKKRLIAAKDV